MAADLSASDDGESYTIINQYTDCTPSRDDKCIDLIMKADVHEPSDDTGFFTRVSIKEKKKEESVFCLRLSKERIISLEIAQERQGGTGILRRCCSILMSEGDSRQLIPLTIEEQKVSHESHALAVTALWPAALDEKIGWLTPCTKGERRTFIIHAVLALVGIHDRLQLSVSCPSKVYPTASELQTSKSFVNPNRDAECRYSVIADVTPHTGIMPHRLWISAAGVPLSVDMVRVRLPHLKKSGAALSTNTTLAPRGGVSRHKRSKSEPGTEPNVLRPRTDSKSNTVSDRRNSRRVVTTASYAALPLETSDPVASKRMEAVSSDDDEDDDLAMKKVKGAAILRSSSSTTAVNDSNGGASPSASSASVSGGGGGGGRVAPGRPTSPAPTPILTHSSSTTDVGGLTASSGGVDASEGSSGLGGKPVSSSSPALEPVSEASTPSASSSAPLLAATHKATAFESMSSDENDDDDDDDDGMPSPASPGPSLTSGGRGQQPKSRSGSVADRSKVLELQPLSMDSMESTGGQSTPHSSDNLL